MTCSPTANPACTLRPATAADEPFLERLFSQTLAGLDGLPPDIRRQLARTQYHGRALTYAAEYPHAENLILPLEDGTPVEATTSAVNKPAGVTYDAAGNLYIAALNDHVIRKASIAVAALSLTISLSAAAQRMDLAVTYTAALA